MNEEKRSCHRGERRRERFEWTRLEIVHADAAGIDVGNAEHYVAISRDRDKEPVRRFGCFTANPRQMADWLCQWLLKLHTFGLRSNSFQHDEQIRILRTYWRYRDTQVKEAGCSIQRMQKTLTQMNIQLANAISDLSGLNRNANPPGDTGGRARWQ